MSRISEELLQQQADEFEIELNYQEWLMYNVEEPIYNETRIFNNKVSVLVKKTIMVANRLPKILMYIA